MLGCSDRGFRSRTPGRVALERRLRGLVIAIHRYANGRRLTADDSRWAARVLDRLGEALDNREALDARGSSATTKLDGRG